MSPNVLLAEWEDLDASVETASPEWIEPFVPMRKRVLPGGSVSGTPVELPEVVTLPTDDESPLDLDDKSGASEPVESEDAARDGLVRIAWSIGYRDGIKEGRTVGQAEGFEQGQRDGFALASETARAAAETALAAIRNQMDLTLAGLDELSRSVAAQATALGLEIAEAVLGREIRSSEQPGADAIARAARLLPAPGADGADQVIVRLNPEDVRTLGDLDQAPLAGRDVSVVADPAVPVGGCLMESGATRLDASIEAAMARVRSVLSC